MDTILMTARERRRLTELSRAKDGLQSLGQAARLLGLSRRQVFRLWRAYRDKGDAGVVHGLRGRPSNNARDTLRKRVLARYRERYAGFNAAHAGELLAREKLAVPYSTLYRWLKDQGLIVQPRRCRKHRRRRERKACVGELVQMDGSTHHWLGPGGPEWVLFVMIDDASGRVYARFYVSEDTASAFDLFGRYVRAHGLPGALYVDYDSIYVVNDEQAHEKALQAGKKPPLTQFGRAMEQLGVRIIPASSPQAKGRVERVNRTLQDRLVKELLLEIGKGRILTLAQANAFLEKFLQRFNERFARAPASGVNVHRSVPRGMKLEEVLCVRETRVVGQDWCVRYENRFLQIGKEHVRLSLAGRKVEVLELAAGHLKVLYGTKSLNFVELASAPAKLPARRVSFESRTPWRPGPNHPWRGKQQHPSTPA